MTFKTQIISTVLAAILPMASFAYGRAAKDPLEVIRDRNAFSHQLSSNWKFVCKDEREDTDGTIKDPALNDHLRIFVEDTVFDGLQRLYQLNPSLASLGIKNVIGRKLNFTCDFTDKPFVPESLGSEYRNWLGRYGINLGSEPPLVVTALNLPGPFSSYGGLEEGQKEFKRFVQFGRAIVFHEFLHFMKLDNFSTEKHTSMTDKEHDVIFACTAQVYTAHDPQAIMRAEKYVATEGNWQERYYVNTQTACNSCVLATIEGAKILAGKSSDIRCANADLEYSR